MKPSAQKFSVSTQHYAFAVNAFVDLIKEYGIDEYQFNQAKPHIFISVNNPLSKQKRVTLKDLEDYPYLSFEQGEFNSFHFSEEILSTLSHKKSIRVSDRATLFNLLIGLNGYTISTGIISSELNGNDIIAVPLDIDEEITVGWISHKNITLSQLAKIYVNELNEIVELI